MIHNLSNLSVEELQERIDELAAPIKWLQKAAYEGKYETEGLMVQLRVGTHPLADELQQLLPHGTEHLMRALQESLLASRKMYTSQMHRVMAGQVGK